MKDVVIAHVIRNFLFCRIYELKDTKENVFLMEHNAKIELLRKMGILDSHSPTPKTLPRISSEELPEPLNAQTEKKQGLSHIGKQQSMPL